MSQRRSQRGDDHLDREVAQLRAQLRDARAVLGGELETFRAELESANQELRQANEQLERSRDRYIELYDYAPVAYLTLDRSGLITELNFPAATLLGAVRGQVVGRPLIGFVARESRAVLLEHVRRCRSEAGVIVSELLLRRKGSPALPIELSSRGADAASTATRFHTIMLDLTERRRIAEVLRRSERLAGLGTLTAGIAHEIKNPLHTILLTAQLLRRNAGAALVPDQVHAIEDIVQEVHRCDRIIRNMLLFARDEPTEKWPADANVLVRRVKTMASTCELKCELTIQLAPEALWVRANPTELERVLLNLITNAAHAAGSGGKIELATRGRDGEAYITVSDNGAGIPPEHLPHVFEPFFTTRRGQGGTGLGLSMVHGIVTEHAGTIHVESNPGHGTRFVIRIPLIQTANENQRGV